MKTLVEMPVVSDCEVSMCAFNAHLKCQAKAVNVGHDDVPACDTFFDRREKTVEQPRDAGVGACKTVSCQHNHALECEAPEVKVRMTDDGPRCASFSPV